MLDKLPIFIWKPLMKITARLYTKTWQVKNPNRWVRIIRWTWNNL